jgi:ankyrin repeat protein
VKQKTILTIALLIFVSSRSVYSMNNNQEIHEAAKAGNHRLVLQLIQSGVARINAKNVYRETALHLAVNHGHIRTIRCLLYCGANIDAKTICGRTALHLAAHAGRLRSAQYLLDSKADINAKDTDEMTPLHMAVYGTTVVGRDNLKMVQWLLCNGAGIDAQDKEGRNALHYAAKYGHLEIVQYLIENGADINSRDKRGDTALHYASWQGNIEIVQHLVDKGANVNIQNTCGSSILYYAVGEGHLQLAEYLIKCGADINAQDYKGHTASDYAKKKEKHELLALLQDYSKLEQEAKTNPTQELFEQTIQLGYYGIVKTIVEGHRLHPTKEHIALAKAQWLETKDPVYKKIGRILTAYYGLWNFLLKQMAECQATTQLPTKIVELISTFINSISQEQMKEECCICYNEIDVSVATTACGHGKNFHFECLEQWKETRPNDARCPICRADLV